MQVTILTEGFQYTGYGHVARCMAIAQSFEKRKVKVSFVVNGDDHVVSMLQPYYSVSAFNWMEDTDKLLADFAPFDIVIIDSYLADSAHYCLLQKQASICVYLDDFNRLDYPEGLIMNGTVGAELIPYRQNENRTYLLGKDYVILREPFKHIPTAGKLISEKINTMLITFGGTDPLNMTIKVLPKIVENYANLRKNIILGAGFDRIDEIRSLADDNTYFYSNVDAYSMRNLMLDADVAISAAGQTVNELAITGLPSVIVKVADNQDNNIAGWLYGGFIDSFIDGTKEDVAILLEEYLARLEDKGYRIELSAHGKQAVDGKGTDRLVKVVLRFYCQKNLCVVEANEHDLLPLFDLTNDYEVRNNSFSSAAISLNEHTDWFHAVLMDPTRILYMFYLRENLAGQIRFDREDDYAIISISIAAAFRGLGLAKQMLKMALEELKNKKPDINAVYAYVKKENKPSQHAFLNVGFVECLNDSKEVLKYYYIYENKHI